MFDRLNAEVGNAWELDIRRDLERVIPDFLPTVEKLEYEQLTLVGLILSDGATHEAIRLLFSLTVNDFRDLLHDLTFGSGRSATRAARSLLEHAINMHSIGKSLEGATRYLEHLEQGKVLMFELAPGSDRLGGSDRRRYLQHLKKHGERARRRLKQAIDAYGAWFRRSWSERTLKERADSAGLGHLYEFYRLASLVVHGSAGGSIGTVRNNRRGDVTYRTGPALELAPVAMWMGILAYREAVGALKPIRPDIEFKNFLVELDQLDSLWGAYFAAIRDLDRQLWPAGVVRSPSAVVAFDQNGARRWFLHVPTFGVLIPARPPKLSEERERAVQAMIDSVLSQAPGMFRPDQRLLTATVADVVAMPDFDSKPIPDTALLEYHRPDAKLEMRELRRDDGS